MGFNFFKKKQIEEKKESELIDVFVKYSYEWKEDIPIEERDTIAHPSRPFCQKLMELNRLYTRAEIEQISQNLGYSVFDRMGGDGCRHRWVRQTVIKKK